MTRIIFAGGGTGGHLYPGLAIARALVRLRPTVAPFFVGARRGIERDVLPTTEFPHLLLDLHPLYRAAVWNNWQDVVGAVGAWRAHRRRWSREERPAVDRRHRRLCGGDHARLRRRARHSDRAAGGRQRSRAHGARVQPLVARDLSELSRSGAACSRRIIDGSLIDTGAPIEPPPSPRPDRQLRARALGLSADRAATCCSIYGGSQGSLAINRVVAEWIERGLPDDLFVIWGTGRATFERIQAVRESAGARARLSRADRRGVRRDRPRARARRRHDDGRAVRLGDSRRCSCRCRPPPPTTRRRTP